MYLNDDRDDVAFLGAGSGSSESGPVYSKRDLYERGHVAVCSHRQATCITVFVFSSIFLSSLVIAFARPWNECIIPEIPNNVDETTEIEAVPVATNGETFPWDDVRLPIFIRPINYDLVLTPNLTTLGVKGIIKMIFKVTEETDFIIFHMKGMNITSKTINEKLKIQRILEYPEREQVYLETNQPMKPGKQFSVRLKFEYMLSSSLEGFYLSSYKDQNGKEKRLATTHFEPTYARRAFPCFDEPELKAEFVLTIIHRQDMKVFFNMPLLVQTTVKGTEDLTNSSKLKSHENHDLIGLLRDEFEPTKRMSTYLLAFVICDFGQKTMQTPTNNISVSVIAAQNKIDQTQFALVAATNITDYYEEYFGIKYPLPKQDLIAIPDFGAGAMENWGLITYRETSLLYSETSSSTQSQQWVAIVVAHELAHQWFGNLVTMRWWNDLWLNEGFASWMEYKGVDHLKPDWNMMEQFWSSKLLPALHLDSLATSHPVSVPVRDPKEIEAIFDTISYKKGSSIIHMLESYIGEEDLRTGLKQYLNKHQFKNAVTRDLWKALTDASTKKVNVEGMMNTWTLQMGYPLITFSKSDDGNWFISQSRFLASSLLNTTDYDYPKSPFNYTWAVPINYITNSGQFSQSFMNVNDTNKKIDFPKSGLKWFKANVNGSGYYRVQYPRNIWEALSKQLNVDHNVFSAVDRAQLLDDAFSLFKAGLLDETIPLTMLGYLTKEKSLVPWEVALSHLSHLNLLFRESNFRELLKKFTRNLLGPIYDTLGWVDKGNHVDRLLRVKVIRALIEADHKDAVEKTKEMFVAFKKENKTVPSNLRILVFSVGIMTGNQDDWNWCYDLYTNTNIPSDRALLLSAMGDSNDIFVLQNYLSLSLNQSQVRGQDVHSVLSSVASNPSGTLLAWRHLQRYWNNIWEHFHAGSFTMGGIIKSVVGKFSTEFDYSQVRSFFSSKDVGAGELALKQTLEEIQINIEFRKKYEQKISEWLDENVS